eukprot:m.141464 g.141464  ORF g.141464 m.141464 type:complete len:155 (-) comp16125_c0_seq33:2674-3138(-)
MYVCDCHQAVSWPASLLVTSSATLPTCIVHGNRDEVVPFHHGERLYAASVGTPKRFVEFTGDHSRFPRGWDKALLDFLRELPAMQAMAPPRSGMLQSLFSPQTAVTEQLLPFRTPKCDLDARLRAQEARVAALMKWQGRLERTVRWFQGFGGGN